MTRGLRTLEESDRESLAVHRAQTNQRRMQRQNDFQVRFSLLEANRRGEFSSNDYEVFFYKFKKIKNGLIY